MGWIGFLNGGQMLAGGRWEKMKGRIVGWQGLVYRRVAGGVSWGW